MSGPSYGISAPGQAIDDARWLQASRTVPQAAEMAFPGGALQEHIERMRQATARAKRSIEVAHGILYGGPVPMPQMVTHDGPGGSVTGALNCLADEITIVEELSGALERSLRGG